MRVSISPADFEVWGRVTSSPAESGAEPWPKTELMLSQHDKMHPLLETLRYGL